MKFLGLGLLKRRIKHFWQRKTRGWDDSDLWHLDHTLAKWLAPRLERFRDVTISRPVDMPLSEWEDILDEMVWTFKFLGSEDRWSCFDDEEWERVDKGLDLFGKYYRDLWI